MKKRFNAGKALLQRGYMKAGVAAGSVMASGIAFADAGDPTDAASYMPNVSLAGVAAVLTGIVGAGIVWELIFKGQGLSKRGIRKA